MNIVKEKILITGGAGFIGSNLCEYFLTKGYQVRVLDNFSTGYEHNISEYTSNPNFEVILGIWKLAKKLLKGSVIFYTKRR